MSPSRVGRPLTATATAATRLHRGGRTGTRDGRRPARTPARRPSRSRPHRGRAGRGRARRSAVTLSVPQNATLPAGVSLAETPSATVHDHRRRHRDGLGGWPRLPSEGAVGGVHGEPVGGGADSDVTLAWTTADGTAEAASDYTAVTAGSATVTAGADQRHFLGPDHRGRAGRGRRDVHGDALRALRTSPCRAGSACRTPPLPPPAPSPMTIPPRRRWCSPWPRRRVAEDASKATTVTVTGTLEGGVAFTTATAVTVSVAGGTADRRHRLRRGIAISP